MWLAIDPGTYKSAWVLYDPISHTIKRHAVEDNRELLAEIRAGRLKGDHLAVEMVASYGMAVGKEVFETVLWIGRFLEAAEQQGTVGELVYRREVKLLLCQSIKAADPNIRAAIKDKFGGEAAVGTKAAPGPLYGIKADEWAAVGVALTAHGRAA